MSSGTFNFAPSLGEAGLAASGYGAGGGGAAITASQTEQAGGDGSGGICWVNEYQ